MTSTTFCQPSPVAGLFSSRGSAGKARAWHTATAFATEVVSQLRSRHAAWRQTRALSAMGDHLLQDIQAPHWLHQRARQHQQADHYEQMKAMARLKY